MQFLTPSCVAWFLFSFFDKPEIGWELIFNVSVLGLVFVSILNATTEVGSLSINIKPIYDYFIDEAFNQIAEEQTIKTAIFWTELELELNPLNPNNLFFLKNYFLHDISLSEQEKEDYKNQINKILTLQEQLRKIPEVILLFKKVRRKDFPEVLKQFNIREEFLKQYFPKKYPK